MEGREVNNNVKGKVVVKDAEEWLCVSRLPPDITEDEFYDLLTEFGGVEESFLIHSDIQGSFTIPTLDDIRLVFFYPLENATCVFVCLTE